MKFNFSRLPKTRNAQIFERMFMSGFESLKNFVQYNKIQDELTDDDLHMLGHMLAHGLEQWCEFLKMADDQTKGRRNDF